MIKLPVKVLIMDTLYTVVQGNMGNGKAADDYCYDANTRTITVQASLPLPDKVRALWYAVSALAGKCGGVDIETLYLAILLANPRLCAALADCAEYARSTLQEEREC